MPKYREGWRPNRLCKVCGTIKGGDESLFQRVAGSRQYIKGGESLKSIAADYTGRFEYQSLYNHARKHQAPSAEDLVVKRVNAAQAKLDGKQYQQLVQSLDARQNVIERLNDILQNPGKFEGLEIKDQVNFLLKALKDSDDVKAKQKDQDLDIMKMMMGSRSGEVVFDGDQEEYDPWTSN